MLFTEHSSPGRKGFADGTTCHEERQCTGDGNSRRSPKGLAHDHTYQIAGYLDRDDRDREIPSPPPMFDPAHSGRE